MGLAPSMTLLIAMVLALLGEGLLCLPRPDASRPLVPRPLEAAA